MNRAWLVLAGQLLLIVSLWGKMVWDRGRLPRAIAVAEIVDPEHPLRGRYWRLNLYPTTSEGYTGPVRLGASSDGRLTALPTQEVTGIAVVQDHLGRYRLRESVDLYVPDTAQTPKESLQLEVSIPERGRPRPIRIVP